MRCFQQPAPDKLPGTQFSPKFDSQKATDDRKHWTAEQEAKTRQPTHGYDDSE